MPKRVDVNDLVGAAEIADRLGTMPATIHQWRRRHEDFPAPVVMLRQAMVWLWPEIERWARQTGRIEEDK